ncbi:MAG: hypothetical protein QOF51_2548 [Chloroflexota bacterium]|nr:hypothetical protein [Chloroflexota bacterium]
METPGFSIWILLVLIALLFVVLWGMLFAFLAFATWIIARTRVPEEEPRRRDPYDFPSDPI